MGSKVIMFSVAIIVTFAVLLVAVPICTTIAIFAVSPMTGGTRLISRGMVIRDAVILKRGYINLAVSTPVT